MNLATAPPTTAPVNRPVAQPVSGGAETAMMKAFTQSWAVVDGSLRVCVLNFANKFCLLIPNFPEGQVQ